MSVPDDIVERMHARMVNPAIPLFDELPDGGVSVPVGGFMVITEEGVRYSL